MMNRHFLKCYQDRIGDETIQSDGGAYEKLNVVAREFYCSLGAASSGLFCLATRHNYDGKRSAICEGERQNATHGGMGRRLCQRVLRDVHEKIKLRSELERVFCKIKGRHERFQLGSFCFASLSSNYKTKIDLQQKLGEGREIAETVGKELRIPVPKAKLPVIGEVKSLVVKQLICGIIAGGVASTLLTPLEILRTRIVAGRGGQSTVDVLHNVIKQEGKHSLLQGSLLISVLLSSLEKGVQFTTYEAVRRIEEEQIGGDFKWLPKLPSSVPVSTVAGAFAGLASTLATYPFSTISDRVCLQPDLYPSLLGAAFKVIKEEGISGLYRGITPAIISMVPSAAISFYSYDKLKKWHARKNKDADVFSSLLMGGAAGVVATVLTYPVEVVRKQISLSALPRGTVGVKGVLDYSSVSEAVRGIVGKEGVMGFYTGFGVELVKAVPYVALSFMAYEIAKRALLAQGEEARDEVKDGDHPL